MFVNGRGGRGKVAVNLKTMTRELRDLLRFWAGHSSLRAAEEIFMAGGPFGCNPPEACGGEVCGQYGFHPGLMPVPFVGDLERARVYLLMLNPSFKPEYYLDEYKYHQNIADNLAHTGEQSFWPVRDDDGTDFEKYWRRVLRPVYNEIGSWDPIEKNFAMLNLVPYRSRHFKCEGMFGAESCKRMLAFAESDLATRKGTLVIVARRPRVWRVDPHDCCLIRFSGVQCRGIQLHPYAREIAQRLCRA